jgi:hypothetical protein
MDTENTTLQNKAEKADVGILETIGEVEVFILY